MPGRSQVALRTESVAMSDGATHDVFNQSPPYGGINLFEADPLINSAASGFPDSVRQELAELGGFWGTHEAREFARLANRNVAGAASATTRGATASTR